MFVIADVQISGVYCRLRHVGVTSGHVSAVNEVSAVAIRPIDKEIFQTTAMLLHEFFSEAP